LGLLAGTNKVMEMVNLGKSPALTNQIAWGKVSLKSLEITSDNQDVSHRLSAFNEKKSYCVDSSALTATKVGIETRGLF
jgi:hypothetical protein